MGIKIGGPFIFNVNNPSSNYFTVNDFAFLSSVETVDLCGDFNSHHGMWVSRPGNGNGRNLFGMKIQLRCILVF